MAKVKRVATPKKDNTNAWLIAALVLAFFLHGGKVGPVAPPPIATEGFRVLVIEETSDRGKLPLGQLNQITATAPGSVVAFCRDKCIKTATDSGFKILDKDDDPALLGEPWVSAWKNKGDSVPWLLVSNGKSGFSGPLPATAKETLEIFGRYAK